MKKQLINLEPVREQVKQKLLEKYDTSKLMNTTNVELKVDVAAGQGGTFDYEAGNIRRAPRWIQKIGMEWFWRLILQPSRIVRMMALPQYLIRIIFTKDMTKSKWE